MNPISFFLKKQYEIEDKIQHLLKDIQDMVLRHQNAFEAYLEDVWDKFEFVPIILEICFKSILVA